MGEETQFSRVEVVHVVAEIFARTFSDVRRSLSRRKLETVRGNSFRTRRLPQLGLTY